MAHIGMCRVQASWFWIWLCKVYLARLEGIYELYNAHMGKTTHLKFLGGIARQLDGLWGLGI